MVPTLELRSYEDAHGGVPFDAWFKKLSRKHTVYAGRVYDALTRLEGGNFQDSESAGKGVLELRLHFGPGFRIYYGRDGDALVVLLAGGTKRNQSKDIADAQARWADYKKRKRRQ